MQLALRVSRLDPPAFVTGFDDIAVMGEAVEQGRGHLRIAEYLGPLAEGQVGGDDQRGPLIELGHQVEEQLSAVAGEGQIAEFVEHDEIDAGQPVRGASALSRQLLLFEPVDQVQ